MPRFSASQRERIRQRLLDVAGPLFAARGYNDVTVDEVVAGAGIAKGTFYGFFSSKEELFIAVVDQEHGQFHARMAVIYNELDVRDRAGVKQALSRSLAELYAHPLLLRVLSERNTPVWLRLINEPWALHQQEQATTALLTEVVRRGQEAGVMREEDPQRLAELFERLLAGLLIASDGSADRTLADLGLALEVLVDGLYKPSPPGGGTP